MVKVGLDPDVVNTCNHDQWSNPTPLPIDGEAVWVSTCWTCSLTVWLKPDQTTGYFNNGMIPFDQDQHG